MIVAYSYVVENFISWYSDNTYESYLVINRAIGHYRVSFWLLVLFNVVIVQLLWWKSIRQNVIVLFIISILVNVGMWLERFVIVVASLARDYMPSAWHIFVPTIWDYAILFGSIGLFFLLFLLFVRTLPVISISEIKVNLIMRRLKIEKRYERPSIGKKNLWTLCSI